MPRKAHDNTGDRIGLYLVEEVITMGEAKRRKKLDPSFGQDFFSSLTISDYKRIAKQFIPIEIIESAAVFSWNVQDYVLPEEYRINGWKRDLCELMWNADTKDWLLDAAETITSQQLGAPKKLETKTVFTILAKSLALAAMDYTDEDGVPLCLTNAAIPDED
jgi:hypothetical protein